MLTVVIPALFLVFFVAWKFRETNTKAKYNPSGKTSRLLAFLWWVFPTAIILVLSIINWKSTHKLDPYKAINNTTPPLTIQVVALQWKWLFIYPQQDIATVNFVTFPEKTPINFELTADAPMNSFWIPQLGGQMYAMEGMKTKLHLIADTKGDFAGSAAEISGEGFAGMKFRAKSTTQADFDAWVKTVKRSAQPLDLTTYNNLAEPSEDVPQTFYTSVEKDLFNAIIMKYHLSPSNMGMEHSEHK